MKMVSFVFLTRYDWPGRMDHKAASGKKKQPKAQYNAATKGARNKKSVGFAIRCCFSRFNFPLGPGRKL